MDSFPEKVEASEIRNAVYMNGDRYSVCGSVVKVSKMPNLTKGIRYGL
jgi:hypothetical protein